MKRIALALALLLAPSAAWAQCSGVFPNDSLCANQTGASNTPRATAYSSLPFGVTYPTLTAAAVAIIPSGVVVVHTSGYATAGDNGAANYVRISPSSTAAWRFQSADGQWWALNDRIVTPEVFGCSVGSSDNTACFQALTTWINQYTLGGVTINFSSLGNYAVWPAGTTPAPLIWLVGSGGGYNGNSTTWNFNGSCLTTNNNFLNQVSPYVFLLTNVNGITRNQPCYIQTLTQAAPEFAQIQGSISGTTLHVTSVTAGTVGLNQWVSGASVTDSNTLIIAQLTTAGGDVSTWQLNESWSIGSQEFDMLNFSPAHGGFFETINDSGGPYTTGLIDNDLTQIGGTSGQLCNIQVVPGAAGPSNFLTNNAYVSDVYYGFNYAQCGDGVRGNNIHAHNVGRVYFPYGVSRHTFDIIDSGGGPFNANLLKVYVVPGGRNYLNDIQLRYRNSGRTNPLLSQSLVEIEFQQQVASPTVSGAVSAGGLIKLTVNSTANMATGQTWFVSGITGTTEANGTWVVTVNDSTHVTLQGSTFTNGYSAGGTLTVPAAMRNVAIDLDINNDSNQQPLAVGTFKFTSTGAEDTTNTSSYTIDNLSISGSIRNYNYGTDAIDLFTPSSTNVQTGGTWTSDTINNVSLHDLSITGTNSAVNIVSAPINLLNLRNIISYPKTSSLPWSIGSLGANIRVENVSAYGIVDRATVVPALSSTSVMTGISSVDGTIHSIPIGTGVASAIAFNTGLPGAVLVNGAAAPTIASGFCSTGSPVTTVDASNGTAAFDILIGQSTCGQTGTLTMPAAPTGWACSAVDVTTLTHNIKQTGTQGSTTAVVLTDYAQVAGTAQNFNPADHIHVTCTGY